MSSQTTAAQGKLLQHFKMQVVSFLDSLIERFPNEGDFVHYRIFLNTIISEKDLLTQFIYSSSGEETRNRIKNRDETLFDLDVKPKIVISNPLITEEKVIEKVMKFKRVWKTDTSLDREDKEAIWRWLDAFIIIADKYSATVSGK